MTSVHKETLYSNPKIKINNRGGNLTSNGGLMIVTEYLDRIGSSIQVNRLVRFNDPRKFHLHESLKLLLQVLFQLIVGYQHDSSTNTLQNDPNPKYHKTLLF